MLPRLFFLHFEGTSFVAEDEDGELAGFVCGFLSQTDPEEAYIHFVGVSPEHRGGGVGRTLYERFFAEVRDAGQIRGPLRHVTRRTRTRSPSTRRSDFRSIAWRRTTTGPARTACSCSSG